MLPRRTIVIATGTVVWIASVLMAFAGLQVHSATPGGIHGPDADGEAFLNAHRAPGRSLVVMAIHPECPCTDASLSELGNFLARSRGQCDALLVELDVGEWSAKRASVKLAGVAVPVLHDRDNRIGKSLGAETSGHAVLVDESGTIRFHGGITIARGHHGLSPAQTAMLAVVERREPEFCRSPVFGCPLEDDDTVVR